MKIQLKRNNNDSKSPLIIVYKPGKKTLIHIFFEYGKRYKSSILFI